MLLGDIEHNIFLGDIQTAETRNLGQNICRLFHVLGQIFFTTSETEQDYYP